MAKAIFACYKKSQFIDFEKFGLMVSKELAPDNAAVSDPYISYDDKTFTLIYNPSSTLKTEGHSFRLGLCKDKDDLFVPGTALPKGSFALFRVTPDEVEIATDYASSRTMWYYEDENVFMASTSQRLIISLLGDFQFNEKACGWFLSSGTLGPGHSWDKRLKMVLPRTAISVDRKAWKVSLKHNDNYNFEDGTSNIKTAEEYKIQLENDVTSAVEELNIDPSEWTLALSGGMDSRGILHHLKDEKLKAVTWGLKKSMNYSDSDATIGKKLAAICSMDHHYAEMDYQEDSFPILIDRFLKASEGRIDHLAAYFDALNLWGDLSASGRGVIRGYDAFGRKPPVTNEYQVRRTCNLSISNFDDVEGLPQKYYITRDDIPERLRQKEGENLGDWRDRLWLQHRTPVTTASLEDIKLAYVEVINPLLSEQVVRTVQNLPLELRNNKKVWFNIVNETFPGVPFANREAVQEVHQILMLDDVTKYICKSLESMKENEIFPPEYIEFLVENYTKNETKEDLRRRVRRLVKAYLPKSLENFVRANIGIDPMSVHWLATRSLMAIKINEMYNSNARVLSSVENVQSLA
ncbi:hypothetical protein [Aurantibacter sp.]|uniref:hypothetical protein n=1 Tax=Aurantibacter sp. TaxID=2807103 RepID=UPI003262E017